jgi:hypothetical protein
MKRVNAILATETAAAVLWKMNWMIPNGLTLQWKFAQIDELLRMRMYAQEWEMGDGRWGLGGKAQVALAE